MSRDLLLYRPYAEVFTNVFVRMFREGTKYFRKSSIKSEL